jgi:NAD(P)-dependent dehydrogenase (short-subunit alcohol dehydrogenase family)
MFLKFFKNVYNLYCSVLGHNIYSFPGLYFYTGAKHAVTVLTEGLRRELRDQGLHIRITVRIPPFQTSCILIFAENGIGAISEKLKMLFLSIHFCHFLSM